MGTFREILDLAASRCSTIRLVLHSKEIMPSTFVQLGVPQNICEALTRRGITEPFKIQEATIADGLKGKDICGRAPTGSGKTLAFGIPLIARIKPAQPKKPHGLILVPTRELAEQICKELRTFSGEVSVAVVYGGVGYGPQMKSLRNGVDILVACPGRLEDLIEQKALSLDAVNHVVLDEADRMADMGFMPAVKRILNQTSKKRQTVLFSATLDRDVAKLTKQYQNDPILHEVGEITPDITRATHVYCVSKKAEKSEVTADSVNAVWPAIIFCRTRHGSDRLAKQLKKFGVAADSIHGGKSQNQRQRALTDFGKGKVQALVATDVAARGIHVDGIALVVHFDIPEDHKAYIHRSGRTARAGEEGIVLSIIQPEETRAAKKMQSKLGIAATIKQVIPSDLLEISPAPMDRVKPEPLPENENRDRRNNSSNRNTNRSRSGSKSKGSSGNRQQKKSGPKSKSSSSYQSNGSKNSQTDRAGSSGKSKSSSQKKRSHSSNGTKSQSGPKSRSNSPKNTSGSGGNSNRKQRRAHLQPAGRR
jgi:superfamily II DNA/RNA helicase